MKICRFAVVAALAAAAPSIALALPQPIRVLPGQVISACPKKTTPAARPGLVCTQRIVATGGNPLSGYAFTVKSGTTLPSGVFLTAAGIVTATSKNPPLPKVGAKFINVSVSDGSKTATGRVLFQMDTSPTCGCPAFQGAWGDLPAARAGQPYGVTLPVYGPSSREVLRPVYTWSLKNGALPPGMTLDKTKGVLRGAPIADTAGHGFVFTVKITEKATGSTAFVPSPFILLVK